MIPHSRPLFDAGFQDAASRVVQSGMLARGDEVDLLEAAIACKLNRKYVIAVDSGTSALMLSIRALLQHKGGRVGIPAYACASLLFAVKAAGATPVFMDCSPDLVLDQNKALAAAKSLDALILVHPFGMVEPLIRHAFPCPVIEDIAQSVGASIDGKQVGELADISIGSLYATKPWGGAYGGYIGTQDPHLQQQIRLMTDPDQAGIKQAYAGHHQLSNVHAALALQRINQAYAEQEKRHMLAKKYHEIIENSHFYAVSAQKETVANDFRYMIRTHDADMVIQTLRQQGIAASKPVQTPLHHAVSGAACPQADKAWQTCVSLPMLADMSQDEFEIVSKGLQRCSTY
ncbi:MAG: DegT/DnrJ/EryC1/StrS family aminotransferase [Ghiorsea sp.]